MLGNHCALEDRVFWRVKALYYRRHATRISRDHFFLLDHLEAEGPSDPLIVEVELLETFIEGCPPGIASHELVFAIELVEMLIEEIVFILILYDLSANFEFFGMHTLVPLNVAILGIWCNVRGFATLMVDRLGLPRLLRIVVVVKVRLLLALGMRFAWLLAAGGEEGSVLKIIALHGFSMLFRLTPNSEELANTLFI